MAAEIKLTKSDESPWGFRLTGGRDFGTPLTIIKVTVNSVAEEAGLQVGDILVKINDTDCPPLTHKEAQDLIHLSNNAVTFSVLRGSLSLSDDVIDRLTPLPLRDFKTPEPSAQNRIKECETNENPVSEPAIEVIPIQDLEPEILEELGLNPLPEDFLEKAKRDPSPMPEVRPLSRMASPPSVLQAVEDLGLQDVVQEIERQKEVEETFQPVLTQAEEICQPVITPQVEELKTDDIVETIPLEPLPDQAMEPIEMTADVPPTDPVVPISDEEFAEFISGQEEVIEVEGKNTLGVDFKKFEPQADFLRKSQVFKSIQDNEHVMTRDEKDRRWTTFLEKPKGPKPKPRPKPSPQYIVEAAPEPVAEQAVEERKGLYELPTEEEFEALIRIPTTPPKVEPETEQVAPEQAEQTNPEDESGDLTKQQLVEEQENLQQQLLLEKELNPELFGVEKSEIELQLEEIQRQLQAIQQLPFEIQQHLALVQEQLNKIVQQRVHEQDEDTEGPTCPRPSMASPSTIIDNLEQIQGKHQLASVEESQNELSETQEAEPAGETEPLTEEVHEEKAPEFRLRTEEEPPVLPPPKKERPRKKRPFLGLGPAPRPLVLPGGRKWRSPKDAYNDEFIAETLSAQAEIITGHTLGVNFLRYEPKPVGLTHLRDSTVYKMIHDLEDPDVVNKGLASRPEIVPSLQDYCQQQSAPAAT